MRALPGEAANETAGKRTVIGEACQIDGPVSQSVVDDFEATNGTVDEALVEKYTEMLG